MRGRNKPWANDFINDNAHLIYNKELEDNTYFILNPKKKKKLE